MVKYKNFGSSSQHQTIGSFSFSSHNSQHSTKTTRTGKSNRSKSRDERSPSITRRREEESDYIIESRDEVGSRFDPRTLANVSTEEDIKEGEEESLYDMISYNGVTDEHSTSVCASYSYSAGDTDETQSSAGISDSREAPKYSRRAKLSYMGYVPVSPNTAAAMAMLERREDNQTHRHRNSNNDSANNNSGHTAGEASGTTGSTFPPIKVDDTSTSRRRRRDYDNDSRSDEAQKNDSASVATGPTVLTDERNVEGITEYISAAQQRELQKQEAEKQQSKNRDSTTVTTSSVADHTHTDTSYESSVRPNSCTGHPAMRMMNKGSQSRQQQQQQSHGQYNKPSSDKYTTEQDFKPLSPIIASPMPQEQHQSHSKADASASGNRGWADNISVLSPGSARVSAHGMIPPSLNHPPAMMQPHWNQNNARFQHQYGQQQQPPAQNYQNHLPPMHPYGPGGNFQQYSPYQQQYQQSQQQQQQQPFQSGFFPRNPVLARQLQAFHHYHNQQEKEKQPTSPATPTPPAVTSPNSDASKNSFKPVKQEQNAEKSSSHRSKGSDPNKGENTNGPDEARLMENVKFITPVPRRGGSPTDTNGSLSTHSRLYSGSYGSVRIINDECARHPAGMKCQSMFANMLNTCGAIVTHGYHTDNTKASSKEKRSKFSKVAEESIAAFIPANEHSQRGNDEAKDDEPSTVGIGAIGSGSFAAKVINAGNSMMSTLPKDFQNLTQSAAVHNVFDTFQKFNPAASFQSEEGAGIRAALSDDPDEVEAAKEEAKKNPVSPHSQRLHFKQLRRRRNRSYDSPVRKSGSEPSQTLSPVSPKEKGSEEFKARYSRNLHTKLFSEKLENASVPDDGMEPEELMEEVQSENTTGRDPDGTKDDESEFSWATPISREEERTEEKSLPVEKDPSPGTGSSEKNSTEPGDPNPEKSELSDSLNEVLGERITGDVVISTSSGMSDSLVGSDVGDEEPQPLDSMLNSQSEDERQEGMESDEDDERDDQRIILDSYEEFPHTPLHVIEEGSEDEDTTVKSVYSKPEDVDDLQEVEGHQVGPSPSDENSIDGEMISEGRSMFSVIGVLRILFVTMMVLQCGTIVALWDDIEDTLRAVEGGSEALTAAQDVVSNLKASGVSLVTAARGIINVDKIDISAGDIFSEIELRTTALMGTANHFLTEFVEVRFGTHKAEDDGLTKDEQLFRKLVDDALWADDDIVDDTAWSDDEEIISTTESVEVQLKEETVEEAA